jgi:hypothetical protein
MAGNRIEFAHFGDFDTFDIIRSSASMAGLQDHELPTPIATGLNTMFYVDTEIVKGQTYYYIARVWRGSENFVSSEVLVKAGDELFNLVDLLILANAAVLPSSNIIDYSAYQRSITRVGNVAIVKSIPPLYDDGWLYFNGSSDYISSEISQLTIRDFTFECFVLPDLSKGSAYGRVIQIGANNAAGSLLLYRQANSNPATLTVALGNGSGYNYPIVGTKKLSNTNPNHICLMRKAGYLYLYVDGELDGSSGNFGSFSISSNRIYICANTINSEWFSGYFSAIRLTLSARYNEGGFIPPNVKFPVA